MSNPKHLQDYNWQDILCQELFKDIPPSCFPTLNNYRKVPTSSPSKPAQLELDKEPSDSTRLKHLTNAKILFNQALKWDYLRKNPFHDISITDISKEDWYPIKPAEFQALLKAIDQIPIRKSREKEDHERIIRTKAFYSVMYGCGLRFGEAINLWWDKNIDYLNLLIVTTQFRSTPEASPEPLLSKICGVAGNQS